MPDDDFLEGCDIDFIEHADDAETEALRPLFPDGNPASEDEWRELFDDAS